MVDANRAQDVWGGDWVDGVGLYGTNAFHGLSCAAVHNVPANSTAVRAIWRMRFAGHKNYGGLNPDFEDPLGVASFRGTVPPDPDNGSDSVDLMLDVTQDYTANIAGIPATAVVNIDAEPVVGQYHRNHSHVWPFRVRMNRSGAGALVAGWTGASAINWPTLCEARLFKVTDTSGIVQYIIKLVWYLEIDPPIDHTNLPIVYSDDYILLAAYAGSEITPTSFQSPFFHFDPASAVPIWDEVECTMTATVLGSVTLTVRSLDREFKQTISISGQNAVRSGGLNGVIPVLATDATARVDIGCMYMSTTRYTDLSPATAGIYPNELQQEFAFLTWSMDEVRGEDYEVGVSGGSSTFFSTTFDEYMPATDWAQPQTIDIAAWPKFQTDVFALITESRADSKHPDITDAANVKNFWGDAWRTAALVSFPISTGGLRIDSDGGSSTGSGWQFERNEYLHMQAVADPAGGADARAVLINLANTGNFFYPDPLAVGTKQSVGFGISSDGAMEGGAAKFRFRSSQLGAPTDFAFPGGPGTYEYWLRLPQPKPHSSGGTTGRREQCEMVLFTDLVAETDPGAGAGLGTPPAGIGLRFRGTAITGITVELFVEGTGVDTIHTLLSGLSVNAINDVLLSSVEVGTNVEFQVWVDGIRIPSNATGTADHAVAKSAIDSAGLEHGVGLHVCGSQAAKAAGVNGFAHVLATNSFGCGAGRHQGVFHRKNDNSLQDIESILDVAGNRALWSNDQACGPNPNDTEGPHYFRGGRVRISNANGTSTYATNGLTKYFSLIQPGSSEAQPFPAVDPDVPMIISGGFPTKLDGDIISGETTGGTNPDMAVWRGVFMRGKADEWRHLDGLTLSVGQPFTAGAAADMFVAKGVNGILWGNPSNVGGNLLVSDLRIQIVLVKDDGVSTLLSPANLISVNLPDPPDVFLFKLVLTETIDIGNDDERTFTLQAFPGLIGGGFGAGAAATTVLVVPGAEWTSSGMGEELGCFYGLARPDGGNGVLGLGVNTTWMTEISATITQGTTTPETAFNSLMATAIGPQEVTIQDVRGVVTSKSFKSITDVRGRVEGDISQRFDLPLSRRLLVFERDENGNVPGSFLSASDGDWYRIGLDAGGGNIQWGDPIRNYNEVMLQEHRISPMNINYQPDGTTTMQLRQETISFTGGHLRPGMLIIYVEEVLGRLWDQDPISQAIYGGNGVKILFRGEITGAARSRERSEIIYEARGPEFIASRVNLLDLSDCDVGKIAYNVEPGSIQTPYAVSKNLTFGPGDIVPQHSAQNVGSMLGYGQPDLIAMTLADIIEHFVNQYAQKLNGLGILRLNAAGIMTVANGDGTVTVFGPKSTLQPINIAPNISGWGYEATSSIVWRPNREAFKLIPTETVLSGLVMDILRGFLANLPDVRLRIEPTTMRWSIETTRSLRSITINSSLPGASVELADDSTEVFTAAVFSSPWREEESFDASLKNGTIQPAWLDGVDIEGDWMEPFAQIGKFTGEVTSVKNFPYQDPNSSVITGPQSTVLVIRVNVGDDPLAVGSFNGATCKFVTGAALGHSATVKSSGQHGGFSGGFQYFDVVIEPPLDGSWGAGVVNVVGDTVEINDDPNEPTTNSASAYRRTWSDYVLVDPDSGRIVNNLAPGGSWKLDEQLPNGCPTGQGDVYGTLPANSAVVNGQLVTTPYPFSSGASSCTPGKSLAAMACGGDIVYRAVRIQEGTWCVRSPEVGFQGTGYRDIIEHDGVITAVHSDGKGFIDTNSHFLPHQWEPHGGSLTKVLMVGGFKTTFVVFPPNANQDNVNDAITGQTFVGGWDVDPSDTPQNDQFFEERSLDADQNVAEWNDDAGNVWHTTNGIRFKGSPWGARRGCIISRHIPNGPNGAASAFTPLGLSTSSTKDTALNNNVQLQVTLRLDEDDAVTSLASVALILRGENGFLEQIRVPPGDIPGGSPSSAFFDDTLIKIDTSTGEIGGATGREFQRGIVAHASRMEGYSGVGGSFPADYIPNWISSVGSRKSFREASTPTGGGAYAGLNLLGTDGDVMDARYPNTDPALGAPIVTLTSGAQDRYTAGSTTFTAAQKARKRGLELGTTGYVFRYVRGDEPDSLVDSAELSANRDRAYPTLFWYHTRVAVDSAGFPVLASDGEPIFEGVKEIIWQGNLSTGVTNAALNNGGSELTVKFSVETPVPNGLTNKLTISVSPLIPFAFSTFVSHDPRRMYHNQVNGPQFGGLYHFTKNLVDGCYSDWNMGFSMVQGASGFGVGVGKVQMTAGIGGAPQSQTTSGPAKVTSIRINQINRPPFNFGHNGISTTQASELLAGDYNANAAKIGYVTESDRHGIRFAHDAVEHTDPTNGQYTPTVGDHYRLYVDRGWGIARMAVFEASGLDDPNKVWIFRHMADSALKSAQNRLHVGQVVVQGIAHEVADGAVKVNVSSEDGYTGLEDMEQISGGLVFEFEPNRRTIFNVNQDGRGVFSKIEAILSKQAQKDAVEQVPSFLSKDNQFNQGKQKSLAPAGLNFTSLPGFGGTSPYTCANNVIVSDNLGGGTQDLIAALQQQRDEIHRLYVLVDANKDPGDDPPPESAGLVAQDGSSAHGPGNPSTETRILNKMRQEGRDLGDLVFPDKAYRDETDGQLYGIVADKRSGKIGVVFAWKPVMKDPANANIYIVDPAKLGRRPREAGSSRLTVGNGSPLDNSYTLTSTFIHPNVSVYAGTGFVAGTGATAVDGDLVTSNNLPGFNVNVSGTDVTISATDDFGPVHVLLTS